MSPAEQQARSSVHIHRPHVVVPTVDGLALFICRGAERELVAIFDQTDDLAGYFIQHSTEMRAEHDRKAALEARRNRDPLAGLELDLDL